MEKIRIYLDNCCFNRSYDDQSQLRIELETKAKLFIQDLVLSGQIVLAWSYMLNFENGKNPFVQRRFAIQKWRDLATSDTGETSGILRMARTLAGSGLRAADALHLACAAALGCDYFVTVDVGILKKANDLPIVVCDPVNFFRIWEEISCGE